MTRNNKNGAPTARREYVRTDDSIPVFYEPYSEGAGSNAPFDFEGVFSEMEPAAEDNPKLYEMLFDINQKLNILISHLTDKTAFSMPEAREVNISGGGIRFVSSTEFSKGDLLTLKTYLPGYASIVRLKCEVVRVEPGPTGFQTAVKFVDMDEAMREKIIRYVFSRQRKNLRTEKESVN